MRRSARAVLLLVAAAGLAAVPATAETPLPPDRLRDSGLEAWQGGRCLSAYIRLRQYLEREPAAADRARVEGPVALCREALLRAAPGQSVITASVEQRRDSQHPPERSFARLAARDGHVTVDSVRGPGPSGAQWQRSGDATPEAYAAFVGRLLDAPAFRVHLPQQVFDPNLPGPRRAVTLSIAIGDERWEGQALRGEPYEKLLEAAGRVLDFARSTPLEPPATRPGAGATRP